FGDSQFTSTLSVNFHFPKIPRRTKKNGHPMMTVESNEGNSRTNRLPPTAGKSGAHAPNSWAYPSGSAVKKL
ncbi:hypothetical protein ACV1C9_20910, partial [Aeromonas caviae]